MTRRIGTVLPKRSGRNSNYLVYSNLRTPHGLLKRVLCEVFLPTPGSPQIVITFYPKPAQATALQFCPSFAFRAKTKQAGYGFDISADEVWSDGIVSGSQDGILFVSTFDGHPTWLELTRTFGRKSGTKIVRGLFRLSKSPLINAALSMVHSYDGSVRVRRIVIPKFTLRCGLKLQFKQHFETTQGSARESITTSHLVAEFRAPRPVTRTDFAVAIEDLEGFLLLLSFASRYRCICERWSVSDNHGGDRQHFRQNITPPKGPVPSTNDTVIDIALFSKFIRKVYNEYMKASSRDLLNNVMFALTCELATTGDRFLRYFSGLESALLHVYRSRGGLKRFRPVKELFLFFNQHYTVNLDDLWPLFDRSAGVPSTHIRNRVVHGEPLTSNEEYALIYATQSLRWTVERLLLAILGWPIAKSKVTSAFLTHFATHDWKSVIGRFRP
jgi:hypothetical protein